MSKLGIVTTNILKRLFRKPVSYLLYIVLPIVVSVGLFLAFSGQESSKIGMALVDMDHSVSSHAVMENIERTQKFDIAEMSLEESRRLVAEGEIYFGYVIPDGFEQAILNQEMPEIVIEATGLNEGTGWIKDISDYQIQNIMDMAYAAEYDKDILHQMIEDIETGSVSLETINVADMAVAKDSATSALGMYIMVIMITTFTIAFLILEEKQGGTYARIGMAPVNPKIYTLSNILANILTAIVQIAMVLLILSMVNMTFFMSPYILFIILLCFAICGVCVGMMLAAFAKKTQMAGTLFSLVLAPSCMLAGCFWPVDFMPDYLKTASYITPQRWILDAIELMQSGNAFRSIIPHLSIVLAFALLFFLIASYRFKVEEKKIG